MKRNLVLRREPLFELTPRELSAIAGADSGPACPVWQFLQDAFDDPTILWCRTV